MGNLSTMLAFDFGRGGQPVTKISINPTCVSRDIYSVFGETICFFDPHLPIRNHVFGPTAPAPDSRGRGCRATSEKASYVSLFSHSSFLLPKTNLLWSAETILERLNAEGSSVSEPPSLSFDFGVRRTFAIEPPDACARHRTLCLTNRKLTYTLP